MTQTHCTMKRHTFTHLADIERGQIAAYIYEDLGVREIARKVGRNASTISREIKCGTVEQIDTTRKLYMKYSPDVDARVYEEPGTLRSSFYCDEGSGIYPFHRR